MPPDAEKYLSRPLAPLSASGRATMDQVIAHYPGMPVMAWWRVPEILLLRRVSMTPPILDLGCGDGRIAEVVFGSQDGIAVGVDLSTRDLARARRRGVYRVVLRANLQKPLPVRDQQFETVFSNSVFEHVPKIEPVFAEIRRVLRPGGRLVFTVPSEHLNRMLRWPRRIERTLGHRAASRWQQWWDQKVAHVNLEGEAHWKQVLQAEGLRLVACRPLLSAQAIAAYERWQLLHNLGVGKINLGNLVRGFAEAPARLGWNVPMRSLTSWTQRHAEQLLEGEPALPGADLMFIATRQLKTYNGHEKDEEKWNAARVLP